MKNKHPKKAISFISDLVGPSRFLVFLAAWAVVVLLTACSLGSTENQSNSEAIPTPSPATKSSPDTGLPPATSGGYSIFDETMVDMTWPEVEEAAKEGAVILITTAVIEEHGPHMGCGIDTYLGYLTCKLTRRELESRGIRTLIAPPFYWGINRTTHVFPGTFTVRPETMKAVLHDIFASLKSWGFTDIIKSVT